MSVTTRRRAVRAIAPVAGLLAAGLLVWQGSYAAFSASSSNTANAWTTGTLSLTNNGGGSTYNATTTGVFAQTGMKVGDTGQKCITVNANAAVNAADTNSLSFYRGAITTGTVPSETAAQRDALAGALNLTVTAVNLGSATGNVDSTCSGFPTTGISPVYSGTLAAVPTAFGAPTSITVPANTQRIAYKFVWTLNTTGTGAGDNALQGTSVGADLVWELQ